MNVLGRLHRKPSENFTALAGPAQLASELLSSFSRMTKSFEVISEAVRRTKHAFAKGDNHTSKPLRHRYERRKVRGYLNLSDWVVGDPS